VERVSDFYRVTKNNAHTEVAAKMPVVAQSRFLEAIWHLPEESLMQVRVQFEGERVPSDELLCTRQRNGLFFVETPGARGCSNEAEEDGGDTGVREQLGPKLTRNGSSRTSSIEARLRRHRTRLAAHTHTYSK
jgi:hypothetical protein